jgi:ATP-dependent DNA ligase
MDTKFEDYPGVIEDGVYKFPPLYKRDTRGKIRMWAIQVEYYSTGTDPLASIPITSDYLKYPLPADLPRHGYGTVAFTRTFSGITNGGKVTESAAKDHGWKNTEKSDERTPVQTALIFAFGQYKTKLKGGSALSPDSAEDSRKLVFGLPIFPMLAAVYEDVVSKTPLKYPQYGQPKKDGIRLIMFQHEDGTLRAFTRDKNPVKPTQHTKDVFEQVSQWIGKFPSCYIDGELYVHGMLLQFIKSRISTNVPDCDDRIELHIHDVFDFSRSELPFEERLKIIKSIPESPQVKITETVLLKDRAADDVYFKSKVELGYEGTMIRDPSAKYFGSHIKDSFIRTKLMLKRKKVDTDEYEIIGFTDGKGTNKGAIVFICKVPDEQILSSEVGSDMTFQVVPNWPLEDRREEFRKASSEASDIIGKPLTVEYRGLSDRGIPQQPRGITIRDYE